MQEAGQKYFIDINQGVAQILAALAFRSVKIPDRKD
jgi:hypothetical protein